MTLATITYSNKRVLRLSVCILCASCAVWRAWSGARALPRAAGGCRGGGHAAAPRVCVCACEDTPGVRQPSGAPHRVTHGVTHGVTRCVTHGVTHGVTRAGIECVMAPPCLHRRFMDKGDAPHYITGLRLLHTIVQVRPIHTGRQAHTCARTPTHAHAGAHTHARGAGWGHGARAGPRGAEGYMAPWAQRRPGLARPPCV
jgi:hypothetical protein